MVRVLGPVDVVGLSSELTSQQLSLLTYLACNGSSTRASLVDALWDGQVVSPGRFPNLLAELRARAGRHHVPEAHDGRYELVAVTTDLERFERGVALANRQDSGSAVATLRSVLELVRGVPLMAPSPRFWSWVGDQTHFAARLEAMVADTAARLARLEQEQGHLEGARWACDQGLLASPTDETLVTTLTEVYVSAGKPGLARRLVEGWEERISSMECGEPSYEPRRRLAG
jgi:DNA-binding SARP family transcriptional activator